MFAKLNYFVYLYSKILKKEIKEIKIILLYDQNRLMNYKPNIYNYIEDHKNIFASLDKYELYFDILYIIPSIGKLSLNYINEKIKKLEEDNKKIKEDNKNATMRILELEKELGLIKEKLKQVDEWQNNSIQQSNPNNSENNQLINDREQKKMNPKTLNQKQMKQNMTKKNIKVKNMKLQKMNHKKLNH